MAENRPPDDELRWPPEEDSLDPTEMLELERTEEGYAGWLSAEPPTWDTYRDWLLLSRRRAATVEPSKVDSADPNASSDPADGLRLELTGDPADTDTTAAEGRSAAATDATSEPVFSGPIDWLPLPDRPRAVAPVPLRLALVAADAPPPVHQAHRRIPVWLERVALFGAGAAAGLAAALLVDLVGPRSRPSTPVVQALAVHPDASITRPAEATASPVPDGALPPAREPSGEPADDTAAAPPATPAAVGTKRATTAAPVAAAPASVNRHTPTPVPPGVIDTVRRYEAAYTRMDAQATQAVWPTADRQQLVATFTALREQRLTLSRCVPTVTDTHATVTCRGTLRYRPRIGDHSTRLESGRWRFDLERAGAGWVVTAVQAP